MLKDGLNTLAMSFAYSFTTYRIIGLPWTCSLMGECRQGVRRSCGVMRRHSTCALEVSSLLEPGRVRALRSNLPKIGKRIPLQGSIDGIMSGSYARR